MVEILHDTVCGMVPDTVVGCIGRLLGASVHRFYILDSARVSSTFEILPRGGGGRED